MVYNGWFLTRNKIESMKFSLYVLVFSFITFSSLCQGVRVNNVQLNVSNNTYFFVQNASSGHVKSSGNSLINNRGTIIIQGEFLNSGSSSVDNNGTIIVAGNWSNTTSNNVFINRNNIGLTMLNGSSLQNISGTTTRFENLRINNTSSGIAINLASDQIVEKAAYLVDGVVVTGTNHLILESTIGADLSEYSNLSFVFGNLRRYLGNNTDTYGLPLGNGTSASNYQLAEIVNGNLTGGGFSYVNTKFSSLIPGGTMTAVEEGTGYSGVCSDGVWHITPNIEPSGGDYDLKLFFTNFACALVDNSFGSLSRSDASADAADWSCAPCGFGDPGINPTNGIGRKVSDGFTLRLGMNDFSQKGIAYTGGGLLPIELVNFEARLIDTRKVELTWTTASEINNDYFTVERSIDGSVWTKQIEIVGAGNSSSTLNYTAFDESIPMGIYFYRLRQTDFDGQSSFYPIVSINNETKSKVKIFPNPASDYLIIESKLDELDDLRIFNVIGKEVLIPLITETESTITLDMQNVPSGLYLIKTKSTVNTILKE